MRTAFLEQLTEYMRKDKKVVAVTADMGFSVFEDLQVEFPDRFINTGVTEQASISVCAGLALSGFKVFFYAQSAFATMRCFEQVRLDLGYNNLDVKVIGTAAGFSLNQLGVSHFSTEDVGLMRLVPNFTVFTPGDPKETTWAMKQAYHMKTPSYIRISRNGSQVFHAKKVTAKLGQGLEIAKGKDATLFVAGGLLYLADEVKKLLKKQGVELSIVSMPTVVPLDKKMILQRAKKHKAIFTLEEHYVTGGLGSAVAETLADAGVRANFYRFGVPDKFLGITGSIPYLLSVCGLSPQKMARKILSILKA